MTPDTLTKLLFLLMLIPLVGGLSLTFIPQGYDRMTKLGAVIFSLAGFLASLVLAWNFDWSNPGMQLAGVLTWVPALALQFSVGVDNIAMWLVLLTTFLSFVVIAASTSAVTHRVKEFFAWMLILEASMVGAFIATDLIFFYLCFEFTLVPIFFLVGVHGSADRLKAARVFFLYTFVGSLLTLVGILYVAWWHYFNKGFWSFAFEDIYATAGLMSSTQQTLVLLSMLAGFAVKVPLFPIHTWQPLTYSEAPTGASALLAGVLLKLSTYGLVRLAIPLAPLAAVKAAPCIAMLAIIGIIYAALIAWVQKDLKKVIAYSSMSHMGFCVLGMFALNLTGLTGSVAYMVNHGLSTAALFLCVGILIERFNTRQITELGGLARVMPVWAFFMVFFVFTSVGLPGLNGFVGEFLTLLGAFTNLERLGPWYAVTAGTGMILAAIYLLYMTGRLVFGPLKYPGLPGSDEHTAGHATPASASQVRDLTGREIALLSSIAICCLWLGLYPKPMLNTLEPSLERAVIARVTPDKVRPIVTDASVPTSQTLASASDQH